MTSRNPAYKAHKVRKLFDKWLIFLGGVGLDLIMRQLKDLDDFIDDDTEPIVDSRVATSVLRKITKYDPTKYNDRMMSDAALERSMRAGYNDIDSEEKRALRMARLEDKLEAKRAGTHAFDSLETSDEDDD